MADGGLSQNFKNYFKFRLSVVSEWFVLYYVTTPDTFAIGLWRRFSRLLPCVRMGTLALVIAGIAGAAVATTSFDLPADSAEKSLKRFSEQAGQEVLFASELTRGVQANRVSGELAPRQAIDLLLANTGLVAVHDPKTGAYSVRKETPEESKKGQRAAQLTASDRPGNQNRRMLATNLPKT